MSTIGSKISFYRRGKGMTQEELAEKLGVSPQAVSKWENDIACPDIQLLPQIAKLFETSVDELLSNDEVKSVQLVPEKERKDMSNLTLKVMIDSTEGDKVRVNIPMSLVFTAMKIGMKVPQVSNNEHLKNVDLEQIMALVESGVIGRLVEIDSEGDHIVITVE